jgi:hypothetical protein
VFKQVAHALDAGDVDSLDKIASALLNRQGETPAGRVPIRDFHQAMEVYLGEGPGKDQVHPPHALDRILSIVRVWQKSRPNSPAAVVAEGMRAYPNDFDMAEIGVIYMIPRWGGSHEQIAAYVEHVLAVAAPESAPFVASKIYYTLVQGGYYYGGLDVVYMLHTSVGAIEQAMATLVARYPDPTNVDKQAVVTCALADKPNLVLLLQEIGDSPLLYYWDDIGKGYYFSLCRQFAGLS